MASEIVKDLQKREEERKKKAAASKQGVQSQIDTLNQQRQQTLQNREKQPLLDKAIRAQDREYNQQLKSLQDQLNAPTQLSAEDKGRQRAAEIIGPEGLERLSADKDVQETLDRYKKISEEGISPAEIAARRARATAGMKEQEQAMSLRLGASLGGSKGAGVAAQQRALAMQGMMGRAGIERDIFLAQEEVKRAGLDKYSERMGQVKQFDISQGMKERDILQTSISGFEQIESAEKQAQIEADAAKKSGGGGGGCVIATHAISTGSFNHADRQRAVDWCVKNLHGNFIGETFRKGYRHIGRKLIKNNEENMAPIYNEFNDWVDFATGKKRTVKGFFKFAYRAVQMFFVGLFIKE